MNSVMSILPVQWVTLYLSGSVVSSGRFVCRKVSIFFTFLTGNERICNYYRPQTKFAKVMFLQVPVCARGGEGGIPACIASSIPVCLAAGRGVVSKHALQERGSLQAHIQGEVEESGQEGSPGPHPGGLQIQRSLFFELPFCFITFWQLVTWTLMSKVVHHGEHFKTYHITTKRYYKVTGRWCRPSAKIHQSSYSFACHVWYTS